MTGPGTSQGHWTPASPVGSPELAPTELPCVGAGPLVGSLILTSHSPLRSFWAGIIRRGLATLQLGSSCHHVGCPQELCVGGVLSALRWWSRWSCFVFFSLIQRLLFWMTWRGTFCQFNNGDDSLVQHSKQVWLAFSGSLYSLCWI